MGQSLTGAWSRKYQVQVPYVDSRRWGTGVNPVHAYRGFTGRPQNSKLNANEMGVPDGVHPASIGDTEPGFVEYGAPWGYEQEDIAGLDVYSSSAIVGIASHERTYDSWPSWDGGVQDGQSTPANRGLIGPRQSRPWGAPQRVYERLRSMRAGAYDDDRWVANQIPVETVSEGWVNKAASGMDEGTYPDDFTQPPDDSQLWVQTSETQRTKQMVNDRAVLRGTDESRSSIPSRLAPMKLKVYSGQEPFMPGVEETYRAYDMFPYQIDDIPRPFYYRTAGTGPQEYLTSNDQFNRQGLQRTPPPDPSMGIPDTQLSDNSEYGYSTEDTGYY
jgi:hypothetical protein